MGGSRSHSDFFFGKSSQNSSKPVLIFWSCIPHVVVSYYDFSVLSMSVMGFQKKSLDGGWVGGWGEVYPSFFLGFLEFFNLAKPLSIMSLLLIESVIDISLTTKFVIVR